MINNSCIWIKKKKTCIIIRERHKRKEMVIEINLLHVLFLFLRGYFRVQRNLFNYL